MYDRDTTIPCVDSGGYNKYSLDRGGQVQPRIFSFVTNYPFLYDYPFSLIHTLDYETGYAGVTKFDSAWRHSATDTNISGQYFDEHDNIIFAKCWRFVNGTWKGYTISSRSYDLSNNLLEQIDSNGYRISIHRYSYDAKNKPISFLEIDHNKSDTTWFYKLSCTYNENGLLTNVYADEWKNPWQKDNMKKNIAFYYSDNKPDSFRSYDLIYKNGEIDSELHILGRYYFSQLNDTIIASIYDVSVNPTTPYYRVTNIFDKSHNKISILTEYRSTPLSNPKGDKFEYSYNHFNQVISEKWQTYDEMGNWTFQKMAKFYYEIYNPGPPYEINEMDIYPSPTKGDLTLKMLLQDAQPFAVCIYNSVGQIIMQWDEPATKKYKKTISLPELASGNYFLRVLIGKQRIVKKFVVN